MSPLRISSKRLSRVKTLVRIDQRLAGDRNEVSFSLGENLLSLRPVENDTDGHGRHSGGMAHRFGIGHLMTATQSLPLTQEIGARTC